MICAVTQKSEPQRQGFERSGGGSTTKSTSASTAQGPHDDRTSRQGKRRTIRASTRSWTTPCPGPASCSRITEMTIPARHLRRGPGETLVGRQGRGAAEGIPQCPCSDTVGTAKPHANHPGRHLACRAGAPVFTQAVKECPRYAEAPRQPLKKNVNGAPGTIRMLNIRIRSRWTVTLSRPRVRAKQ